MILLDPHDRPVIAHRGDRAHAPENTIVACERALAAGADALEIDVRVTADGHDLRDVTLESLRGQIGIPSTLAEAGVPTDEIAGVARMAVEDPSAGTNPIAFTAADYAAILQKALAGDLP